MLSKFLTIFIKFYRLFISPVFPASCRYLPTCSEYAHDALGKHGAFNGSLLIIKRLFRCHPWGGSGYDPVPDNILRSSGTKPAHLPKSNNGGARPRDARPDAVLTENSHK